MWKQQQLGHDQLDGHDHAGKDLERGGHHGHPPTTPKSSTSTASTTSTPSLPTAAAVGAAGAAEYAAVCKSIIQRDPTLPGNTKGKLEGICAKAASGNLAGARAAAKQVCVEVVNASPLPAAEKAKTLAECKSS